MKHPYVILPSSSRSSKWSLSIIHPHQNFVCISWLSIRVTCSAHLISLISFPLSVQITLNYQLTLALSNPYTCFSTFFRNAWNFSSLQHYHYFTDHLKVREFQPCRVATVHQSSGRKPAHIHVHLLTSVLTQSICKHRFLTVSHFTVVATQVGHEQLRCKDNNNSRRVRSTFRGPVAASDDACQSHHALVRILKFTAHFQSWDKEGNTDAVSAANIIITSIEWDDKIIMNVIYGLGTDHCNSFQGTNPAFARQRKSTRNLSQVNL
jgi:hypothetical protein